jgi:hypothetical protein
MGCCRSSRRHLISNEVEALKRGSERRVIFQLRLPRQMNGFYWGILSWTLSDLLSYWPSIKPDHSLVALLGKLYFGQQAPQLQRRKTIVMLSSIGMGLFCGGILAAFMLLYPTTR